MLGIMIICQTEHSMIKIFINTIIILTIGLISHAQNAEYIPSIRPGNNVNLNLFGDASIISINYERLFLNTGTFFLTGKLGIGYSESMKLPNGNTSLLSTPMHISANVNVSKGIHFIEFGLGNTLLFYANFKYWDYSLYTLIVYRLQTLRQGRITVRIFISYPLTGKIDFNDYWFSPVGLNVGYTF